MTHLYRSLLLTLLPSTLLACASDLPDTGQVADDLSSGPPRTVFTMSNAAAGNSVLAFQRTQEGLALATTTATGGKGSEDGLGSQGALAFAFDGRVLLAVNPGSNDVSSFFVAGTTLYPLSRAASGGDRPISVAARDNLVYVLNGGATPTLSGLYLDASGRLHPLPDSTRAVGAGPAQVAFSPDGRSVVVTEKTTNTIDTFAVLHDGRLRAAAAAPSAGRTPFGFAFTSRQQLIVSEASGGGAGAGTMSSYDLVGTADRHADRHAETISGPVPDLQSAPCWVAVTDDDRFAYAANAASGTISGYAVAEDGVLTLFADGGRTADTGAGGKPLDLALDRRSRHLYVLDAGHHEIQTLDVSGDGTLSGAGDAVSVPGAAAGLLAR